MATSRTIAAGAAGGLLTAGLLLTGLPASAALDAATQALHTEEGDRLDLVALTRERRAVVLVFVSGACPCVRRYQARIAELARRFGPGGIAVFGVVSNAKETPADVRRVYPRRQLDVPLIHDPGGRLADAVGARSTPTVAILGPGPELLFLGWIDNEREPGAAGRQPYVERVLEAVLAGRDDFGERSPVYGCRITRQLFGGSVEHDEGGCPGRPSGP